MKLWNYHIEKNETCKHRTDQAFANGYTSGVNTGKTEGRNFAIVVGAVVGLIILVGGICALVYLAWKVRF